MFAEAAESASIVVRQLEQNRAVVEEVASNLLHHEPRAVVTCARGSSDHAATYLKYLLESRLGVITSSAAPSVQSVYKSPQSLEDTLYVVISQSGKSPDLLENVRTAKSSGARILALVNDEESPIASLADFLIPLHAGTEFSVAATKTYIATLTAMLHLSGEWAGDPILKQELASIPAGLEEAWQLEWQPAIDALADANNLYVIARGPGLGVAQEAALKFKEVCGLHAEAFSAAEVRHGPMALIKEGFPVFVFAQDDEAKPGIDSLVRDFHAQGATLLMAAPNVPAGIALPVVTGFHPAIQPILTIQTFYRMSNELEIRRGYDPDHPPNLSKVTQTV